jgi:hypothetical protein
MIAMIILVAVAEEIPIFLMLLQMELGIFLIFSKTMTMKRAIISAIILHFLQPEALL